jgi:glycerate 2-kinase
LIAGLEVRLDEKYPAFMHHIISSCKRDLLDIYKHAIEAVKPDRLIRECVVMKDGKFRVIDRINSNSSTLEYDLNNTRLHVIGGGKCVVAMAKGLAEIANSSQTTNLFSHGCLSAPTFTKSLFENVVTRDLLNSIDVSVKFGSKDNLPDIDSQNATKCIIDAISEASRIDKIDGFRSLFVVLISGGGSACLTSPKYLSLEEKSDVIKMLVQRGADIADLNTVRRFFSNVKGGKLARHILESNPNSVIISLILSDVVGDPVEIIASGPTCLSLNEPDMYESMVNVFERFHLEMPSHMAVDIKGCSLDRGSIHNIVIGNNRVALNTLRDRAIQLGYKTIFLSNNMSGTTSDIVKEILSNDNMDSDRYLIVGGGESVVVKEPGESWGLGGRAQEMALDYMLQKLSNEPSLQNDPYIDMFLAGSTDGQDGPTDVAGCLSSCWDWSLDKSFTVGDIKRAKHSHDSYNFWTKHRPGWLVKTGPTGTNVMDLYMLMKVKAI